jgi:hypothetical protein
MTQEERDRLYPESQRVLDKLAEQRRAEKKSRINKKVQFAERLEEDIRSGGYNPEGKIDEYTLAEGEMLGIGEDKIREYSKNFTRAREIYGEDASIATNKSKLKLRQKFAKRLKSEDSMYGSDRDDSQKILGLSNKQVYKVSDPEYYKENWGTKQPKGNLTGTDTLRTGSLKDPARKIAPEYLRILRLARQARKDGFKETADKLATQGYNMKANTPTIRGQYYGLAKDEQKASLTAAQLASQQPSPSEGPTYVREGPAPAPPEEPDFGEIRTADFRPYRDISAARAVIDNSSHPMHTPSMVASLKKYWNL